MSEVTLKNLKHRVEYTINQSIKLAHKLYNRVPVRFRWIASPLIYFYRFCRLLPKLRLKLWILTGDEQSSQMPLSILYASNDCNAEPIISMNFMLGLMFGESYQKEYLGRAWMWNIHKVIVKKGQSCSLMVVQVYESLRNLLRLSNWFYIPNWVVGEAGIPRDPTVTKDSSLKSDFRRIRKQSLRFEVTQDPQRFDEFYHNMYVPHITKAHGSSAYIISYDYMRAEFQKCELLLVKKQEKRIAGILIDYEEVPRLWSLGVRDSNPEYINDGVVGALFYYSLLYLKGKGYTTINFGLSRAFLRDGVLQYKRKWSQRIVGTTSYGYALKVLTYTDPAKAFLQENPFIFESHEDLHGAVFVNADKALSSEELQQIDKKYFHDGLSKLYIYFFHYVETIEQDRIPPELSGRIVLRSAGDMV